MNQPLVSVIIPVYNVEKYLRECLDSVCNQTLEDIEIICVDDGSTDGSLSILRDYEAKDSRFKIYTQKNKFAGVARNNGFLHATGKYCIFLDSDDWFDKNLLKKTYLKAEKEQADIVAFNFSKFDVEGKVEKRTGIHTEWLPKNTEVFSYADCPDYIMSVVNPTPWTKLYRTSFVAENNLKFDEISTTNDITFASVSVASAKRITFLKDRFIHYRVDQGGTISSAKPKKLGNTLFAVKSALEQVSHLSWYETIRNSVMRFAVDNITYCLKNNVLNINDPGVREFYNGARELFSTTLFEGCSPDAIHSNILFNYFTCLREYDYDSFISLEGQVFNDETIRNALEQKNLYRRSVEESAIKKKLAKPLIVSLTSFPKRIGTVHLTINTIFRQTLAPDRIILWLAEEEFPNKEKDLPDELLKLKKRGLEIRWCGNLMSYKKLVPTMKLYPDSFIVTADDDLYYHPQWLERLCKTYLDNPHCIPCHRVTKILVSEDGSYTAVIGGKEYWKGPSYLNKIGSGSGTLFPPGCFHPDVLDETKIKDLAPTNDDIWFWLMAAMAGYRVVVPKEPLIALHYVEGTQESALWLVNNQGDELFWTQLYNIVDAYPELKQILADEYRAASAAEKEEKERIRALESSFSYRVRRIITWIPRKAKGGIRCIQENGLGYTFNRMLIHLHLKKAPEDKTTRVWNSSPKNNKDKQGEKNKNGE